VAPLEDNAFVLLQTETGQVVNLHTSWTMWKNRFSFEVLGRDGYARIDGLGGSYGIETLTVGRKRAEGSVPEETISKHERPDESWAADWRDLVDAIEQGRNPEVDAGGGLAVMQLVDEIYARAASSSLSATGVS